MTSAVPGTGRLVAVGAVVLVVALVAAACGSTHSPATTASPAAPAASGSTGTAAAPSRIMTDASPCINSTLRPKLAPTGAAAGTAYYALRLTNVSGKTCTVSGYPGVSFVSGVAGRQIGSAATRNPVYPVTTVVLAKNATAHATVGIAATANYPPSRCHPATAHALRVFPPGQTTAVYLKESFPACSARVTVLTVTAMRVGLGGQGS